MMPLLMTDLMYDRHTKSQQHDSDDWQEIIKSIGEKKMLKWTAVATGVGRIKIIIMSEQNMNVNNFWLCCVR